MIVKELERNGIPSVQICNMTPIANAMGAIRILRSNGILYPLGNPELGRDKEKQERKELLWKAIELLAE
ncbi:MAG: hypothetical protein KHW94_09375 [Clostridium sp.]|nr:hypothetical protein [Clostridium sp.]